MTDMQTLVKRGYQALQTADQNAVGSAQATIGSDQQTIGNDQQAIGRDQQTVGRDQQAVAIDQQAVVRAQGVVAATNAVIQSDQAAIGAAQAASRAVGNKQADDKQHMEAIAVQLYEGLPPTSGDEATAPSGGVILASQPVTAVPVLQQAQAQLDQQQYLNTLISNDHATLTGDSAQQKRAAEAVRAAEDKLNKDSAALPGEQQQIANAVQQVGKSQAVVAADQQRVGGDQQTLGRDQQRLGGDQQAVAAAQQKEQADQNALNGALAALNGPPVPRAPGDATPTIMGPTVLTPQDLAGWFGSQHYNDTTPTPVIQYAQWYVSEGKAEGVRGDIAFAQAVIETGGFSNPDSMTANNYAGIGHCDSCGGGMPFPSPQMGVRGQIQLLKAYAVPGLTTPQLANPPAIPQLAPEAQSVHGCCGTWQSLTGVWASSPIYGPVIMGQYLSMLNYGLTQPTPPIGGVPGPPGAPGPAGVTNSGGPPTPQAPQLAPPPG